MKTTKLSDPRDGSKKNKRKVNNNGSSAGVAADKFNSMLSFFEQGDQQEQEQPKPSTENVAPAATTEQVSEPIAVVKKAPKRPKRTFIDSVSPSTENNKDLDSTTSTSTSNTTNNNSNNNDKLKEIEDKELDLLIKEKELKKLKKDIKDEKDKININLARQKQLVELNKQSTISLAIPGNILDDITSAEMKTYLIEMISRTIVMHQIDEVIVYKDSNNDKNDQDNINYLMKILEYIETPDYLRENLFYVLDPDYEYVDKLKKMSSCRQQELDDQHRYREGFVINKPHQGKSVVNVGLGKQVLLDKKIKGSVRVTVELSVSFEQQLQDDQCEFIEGRVVSFMDIKEQGYYWGYHVRVADSLAATLQGSPFESKNYDFTCLVSKSGETYPRPLSQQLMTKKYNHLLLILANHIDNAQNEIPAYQDALDLHINTLLNFKPSFPIRFEEDLLITLTKLKGTVIY
ncbi:hypothetical protein CYY_001079 [Polysphondylium violaceum]|uniref:Uncharacterized protein n=1 Tax=Polysphondylium violaceum TaxID=133409 RepID=A0A8J4Q0N7_9MYCE|nr:hypothetical protein CYY_001079 [Polysphondylium violaceum]